MKERYCTSHGEPVPATHRAQWSAYGGATVTRYLCAHHAWAVSRQRGVTLRTVEQAACKTCRGTGEIHLGSQPYGSPGESYAPCPDCVAPPAAAPQPEGEEA